MSTEQNEHAAEAIGWDAFSEKTNNSSNEKKSSGEEKKEYMTFPESGDYTVRLVGKMVEFRKYFEPINAITHYKMKDQDPVWQAGFFPRRRYAINVIDRSDGKIKILEKGPQIFKAFSKYAESFKVNPSGQEKGVDFVINVDIPMKNGKPNKRSTEYSVMAGPNTPLTEEEQALVESSAYDLPEIYKAYSLESIQKLWDALPDEAKIPPKKEEKEEKAETPAPDTTEAEETAPAKSEEKAETPAPEKEAVPAGGDSAEDPLF